MHRAAPSTREHCPPRELNATWQQWQQLDRSFAIACVHQASTSKESNCNQSSSSFDGANRITLNAAAVPSILHHRYFKSTRRGIARIDTIDRKPASSAELSPSRHPKAHLHHPPIALLAQPNAAARTKSRSASLHHRAKAARHSKPRGQNPTQPQVTRRHCQHHRRTSRDQAQERTAPTHEGYNHQRRQEDTEQQVHTLDSHRGRPAILSIQK